MPSGAEGGSGTDILWARFLQHGGWWPASPSTSSVLPAIPSAPLKVTPAQFQGDEKEYPYFLNLYMSNSLGDGRGANQSWLQGSPDAMTTIAWQTWIELNPKTAQAEGVQEGDIVKVTSPQGEVEGVVYIYPAIRPDTVAMPLGQGHTDYGRYARDRGSNPIQLVSMQMDTAGSGFLWATLRVKISPTGRKMALAKLENTAGATEGFINKGIPGQ